jgi:hypothetical protein
MSDTRLATLDHDSKSSTLQTTITAVDVVLEPDVTMIRQAQAANAALLKNFPKGYALGDEHAPHISVMGGYVYTASLDKLFTAAATVLASEKVTSWKLNLSDQLKTGQRRSGQNRPTREAGTELFYSAASFGGKLVFVRQLRGPHLSTCP